jgi:hypothetical protein
MNKIRVTAVILFYSIHLTHWLEWGRYQGFRLSHDCL